MDIKVQSGGLIPAESPEFHKLFESAKITDMPSSSTDVSVLLVVVADNKQSMDSRDTVLEISPVAGLTISTPKSDIRPNGLLSLISDAPALAAIESAANLLAASWRCGIFQFEITCIGSNEDPKLNGQSKFSITALQYLKNMKNH
ncbi:hypothetical protein H5410_019046 [Solanum commersonii]|uniref:Uncharacterized protein n=1 Tax=Solanum commersonii TaxID=4109 RepID=A0A9J6A3M6_SOLCO|nr:hypothetical protein H5410_019046 [Solanum commersonii]